MRTTVLLTTLVLMAMVLSIVGTVSGQVVIYAEDTDGAATAELTSGAKAVFDGTKLPIDGNVTYAWDFGDGNTGKGPIVTHGFDEGGTYYVVVIASNSTNTTSQIIQVDVEGKTHVQTMAIFGAGLGMFIAGTASAFALGMTGSAAIGVISEKDVNFGKLLALQVLPMTQTIYAFLAAFLVLMGMGIIGGDAVPAAIASDGNMSWIAIAIGLIVGITGISAIPQGIAASASIHAVGRNQDVMSQGITFSAMPETIAIFGLLLAIFVIIGTGLL